MTFLGSHALFSVSNAYRQIYVFPSKINFSNWFFFFLDTNSLPVTQAQNLVIIFDATPTWSHPSHANSKFCSPFYCSVSWFSSTNLIQDPYRIILWLVEDTWTTYSLSPLYVRSKKWTWQFSTYNSRFKLKLSFSTNAPWFMVLLSYFLQCCNYSFCLRICHTHLDGEPINDSESALLTFCSLPLLIEQLWKSNSVVLGAFE